MDLPDPDLSTPIASDSPSHSALIKLFNKADASQKIQGTFVSHIMNVTINLHTCKCIVCRMREILNGWPLVLHRINFHLIHHLGRFQWWTLFRT